MDEGLKSYDDRMRELGFVDAPIGAKKMGFWNALRTDVPNWYAKEVMRKVGIMTQEELTACTEYMAAAKNCAAYMGSANCRLCGCGLGSCDMLTPDEKWLFPEKWEHYIMIHGVRPDEEFIQDAMAWNK